MDKIKFNKLKIAFLVTIMICFTAIAFISGPLLDDTINLFFADKSKVVENNHLVLDSSSLPIQYEGEENEEVTDQKAVFNAIQKLTDTKGIKSVRFIPNDFLTYANSSSKSGDEKDNEVYAKKYEIDMQGYFATDSNEKYKNLKYKYGQGITGDNQIVISQTAAENLKSNKSDDIKDLIGKKINITIGNENPTIVGIYEGKNKINIFEDTYINYSTTEEDELSETVKTSETYKSKRLSLDKSSFFYGPQTQSEDDVLFELYYNNSFPVYFGEKNKYELAIDGEGTLIAQEVKYDKDGNFIGEELTLTNDMKKEILAKYDFRKLKDSNGQYKYQTIGAIDIEKEKGYSNEKIGNMLGIYTYFVGNEIVYDFGNGILVTYLLVMAILIALIAEPIISLRKLKNKSEIKEVEDEIK